MVGELACWRWRAGLRDRLPPGAAAEPYALSLAGEAAQAAKVWRELGCPYEAALALADGDAAEPLRRAHEELQALGARPAAAIVARKLRERGVRGVPRGPRPSTRANPAGLTARELEVLALLARGLRNAAIADELVVSEKTVDHHVSAVLRKLDVRTRGEAAAEAARLGLTRPKIGSGGSQHRCSSRCAPVTAFVGSLHPTGQPIRRTHMPRYVVQRTFPDGLQIPVGNGGSELCQTVVERNAEEGVTWVHSYVSADKRTTFCVYDAPTPEAIRKTAARNELPVDQITQVRVLDPYFYTGEGV